MLSAFLVERMEVNTMEFNETNWKECLEALNFTEGKMNHLAVCLCMMIKECQNLIMIQKNGNDCCLYF